MGLQGMQANITILALVLIFSNHALADAYKCQDKQGDMVYKVSYIRAEGFPAAEVPGFSQGVVVNVRVCK